jgi:hypothetical protein
MSGEESTDDILKLTDEELMDTGEQPREEDIMKNADGLLDSPSARKEIAKKLPVDDKNRNGSVSVLVSNLDIGSGSAKPIVLSGGGDGAGVGDGAGAGTGTGADGTGAGAGIGTGAGFLVVPPNTNATQQPNGSEPPAHIQSIQIPPQDNKNTDPDVHRSAHNYGADPCKRKYAEKKRQFEAVIGTGPVAGTTGTGDGAGTGTGTSMSSGGGVPCRISDGTQSQGKGESGN